MNTSNKLVILSVASLSVLGGAFYGLSSLDTTQLGREIASKSLNLKILEEIPLVSKFENKMRSESSTSYKLANIFKKIADESKNKDGSLNRGTHAKGKCFLGATTLQTDENTPQEILQRIKKGFFSHSGEFKTYIRFANAKGQVNDDREPDVRAMSFAIETDNIIKDPLGGSRLDFMMNSSPMFAVRNIKEFHQLMKSARLAQGDLSQLGINPFYIKSTLRATKLLDKYERTNILSYASENYWSNVPYTHFDNKNDTEEVVKYKVTPCGGASVLQESNENKASDYLQKDISERAMNGEVCFKLQVQLFDREKLANSFSHKNFKKWSNSDWIENGGMHWDEKILPFHTVAKLEIPAGSKPVTCGDRYINTRLHSSHEHRPIGSLARVRVIVEEISRSRRQSER